MLALDGELDLGTSEPVRDALMNAIDNDANGVAVDMRLCSFIDSTGVRILVEAARRLDRDGRRLQLIGISEQPRRVFELTLGGRLELFALSDAA